MATRVASIIAEVGIDGSKFQSGLGGITNGLERMLKGTSSVATGFGIAAAAIGVSIAVMKVLESAAVESAKADAKLEAVLRSTGGAAGMTSDSLNALAEQISKTAGLDDELVKSAEAVMLTFTRVSKESFPEATQVAADMAAVLGGDLQGSVIQVGKAMNDFSGYTALKRAGVSFTEEQIKQIANFKKTNDLASYQKLVLKELSNEFGGAAKAMNDAGDGAENLNVSIGNLKEQFGGSFIGMFRGVNTTLTDMIDGFLKADDIFDDQAKIFNEAGVQVNILNAHYKDGVLLTKEHADEILRNGQVADNMTNSYIALANATAVYGESVALTDEQLAEQAEQVKILTEYNQGLLSTTESFQSADERYQSTNKSLTEERIKLEEERALKLSQGYWATGEVIRELDDKLGENAEKAMENASAHEEAGRRIIFNMLEQRLAVDGLDDRETNFLLEKGRDWGIYSDTAIQEMRDAMAEMEALAGSINGIPNTKDIYIRTHYQSYGEVDVRTAKNLLGGYGAANGADFIVPSGYPNDSYPMRVQSGEHVQVTPAGQSSTSPELKAILRKLDSLPTTLRDVMLMGAG